MPKICDWAKYHNMQEFKKYMSDQAVLLPKGSLNGRIILTK